MVKTMTSHVDIMADIIATMGEHATWDQTSAQQTSIGNHLLSDSFKLSQLSMIDKIWMYVTIFSLVVVRTITLRILYCIGFHMLIYDLLCKPLSKPHEEELTEIRILPTASAPKL